MKQLLWDTTDVDTSTTEPPRRSLRRFLSKRIKITEIKNHRESKSARHSWNIRRANLDEIIKTNIRSQLGRLASAANDDDNSQT